MRVHTFVDSDCKLMDFVEGISFSPVADAISKIFSAATFGWCAGGGGSGRASGVMYSINRF